jgi:predicted alpha-1,2-mannosidase
MPLNDTDRVDLVNLLQGTNSTRVFSRGNTLPIASLPFGMAHWTIQSSSTGAWMFHPEGRRFQGFRSTHQLSPWLADYGHAVFLPYCGECNADPELRSSSWQVETAELHPYSLRLTLNRYRAEVELVPTERCAIITATFSDHEHASFLIEIPGEYGAIRADESSRTISFESKANRGGVPENFATYYIVRFSGMWESFDLSQVSESRIAILRFKDRGSIEARIATSFISFEQAERNLDRELASKPIEKVRAEAQKRWTECLSRIAIEGGTADQRQVFYSCLYRALLFPRLWHEPDADGNLHHFSPYNGKVVPGVMYADHGYWDTYRAWYPLMSIVYPDKLAEILQAWVYAYTEGGWLPQFPAPGYRACMTGSLIDAVFGDAATKGIGNFDLAAAYAGMRKHATQPGDPEHGYGRRGVEDYLRLGYVPHDHVKQSVAETVDAAYGDFCIAQVARTLGHMDEAAEFLDRSRSWHKLFDPEAGFLRGKLANGAWLEPFDEFQWGSPYVEGSAWQHRWDVPHDIPGLIDAMGGKEHAVAALEKMLTTPPVFHVGVCGQEIHEMSEMAAVNFGQYAHSNQPVHHLLYIFAIAGRPDRTQYWVRKVLTELYSPDKFPGDEDTGSMAAWFILSAMGIYPLCPGKAEYVIGGPLFDRVTLHLPDGKKTVIEACNQSPSAAYVSKLFVDDKPYSSPVIQHDQIVRGTRLTFFMQEQTVI